jgi:hypothetical protein
LALALRRGAVLIACHGAPENDGGALTGQAETCRRVAP